MKNREQIKKLRDYAELAWAAYGYFHLVGKKFHSESDDTQREIIKTDILDITYKKFKVAKTTHIGNEQREETIGKLDGDFGKEQAKRFFERYELITHQENTDSGFSATLFGEKRKQKNIESKEISYTSEYGYMNYILSFRGTEFKLEQIKDLINDYYIWE
ncbi:hypothetical protein CQA53_10580 [Helicobacter didelphidarum]|uniref:Uncharacterized protein n=1 Tax=Helicobacter didelphidarum TaxID=2040648 RepID=A0A3D8I8L5_9HELI|nr:hypothetical protein [Helicobacter didelphidarum]RDU60891.1 hypothetical protein CQA53_10580 [Helicobacter didelphidarum]